MTACPSMQDAVQFLNRPMVTRDVFKHMQAENPVHGVVRQRQLLNIRDEDRRKHRRENARVKVGAEDLQLGIQVGELPHLRLRGEVQDAPLPLSRHERRWPAGQEQMQHSVTFVALTLRADRIGHNEPAAVQEPEAIPFPAATRTFDPLGMA